MFESGMVRLGSMAILACPLIFALTATCADAPVIAYAPSGPNGTAGRFEARGLPAGFPGLKTPEKSLSVRVEAGPGLLGTWGSETNGTIWFKPRFPLAFDIRHTARLDLGAGTQPLTTEVILPRPKSAPTTVVSVYPSGTTIPENTLRFYLVFSAPMQHGQAYRHVRLVDAQGKAADLPFLELDEELWDPTGTRLTLLVDPGRIKRGVKPLEDIGPVFESGNRYTLEIDASWPDIHGKALARPYRKEYLAKPAVRERIAPAGWLLTPPARASDPLVVRFPNALDKALIERLITVADSQGNQIAGPNEALPGETGCRFRPEHPWKPGNYTLRIGSALEDPAGNRIDRLFDTEGSARATTAGLLTRPFTVDKAP